MSKTHRVNKYECLYLCVGKAHHPQTLPIPFGRGLTQTVTTGQDWTLLKRSENSLYVWTWSHPIGVWVKYQSCHWCERVLAGGGRYLATTSWNFTLNLNPLGMAVSRPGPRKYLVSIPFSKPEKASSKYLSYSSLQRSCGSWSVELTVHHWLDQ